MERDMTYDQAREDHEYLWNTYGPAFDMTGGYVDQEDLWKLMKSPTKKTARECYESQVAYWFASGCSDGGFDLSTINWTDPMVREIAERHGVLPEGMA